MRGTSLQAVSPAGLAIDINTTEPNPLLVVARAVTLEAACSECGRTSGQIHSRCERYLVDLPSHGRAVHLRVQVRRFRSGNTSGWTTARPHPRSDIP